MASHTRVINLTTGNRLKRSQASNRVQQRISEWVDEGFSIRDLTLAEMVEERSIQSSAEAQEAINLGNTEIPGLVYEPPAQERNFKFQNERAMLLREAREFCRDGGTEEDVRTVQSVQP